MLLAFQQATGELCPLLADTNQKLLDFYPRDLATRLISQLGEEMADGLFGCQIMLMAWAVLLCDDERGGAYAQS